MIGSMLNVSREVQGVDVSMQVAEKMVNDLGLDFSKAGEGVLR